MRELKAQSQHQPSEERIRAGLSLADIAFAGNTEHLIKWSELREQLAKAPPPISSVERCEVLLRIANGEGISAKQWNQLIGISTLVEKSTLDASRRKSISIADRQRKGIADVLQLRVANQHGKLIKNLSRLVASTVVLVPSVSDELRFTVVARDAQGAFAYATWLFIDPAQPFGDDLCRCQHEPCGRFFLYELKGRGRPRRKYCCDEHRKAADDLNARARMKNLREDRINERTKRTTTRKPE